MARISSPTLHCHIPQVTGYPLKHGLPMVSGHPMRRPPVWMGILLAWTTSCCSQAQWTAEQLTSVDSFDSGQRLVGTHYFYWYNHPHEHFTGGDGRDILQDHFPVPGQVSYLDASWHGQQLQDLSEAGIDFMLPVYWGVVGDYDQPGVSFSVRGLPPLLQAMEQRERSHLPTPKIGLFYDTTTLQPGYHGATEKLDLRREHAQDIFYRTIRDYFQRIPPRFWATIDGNPLVVLYGSSFAGPHDQSLVDGVNRRFAEDFSGRRPYLIRDSSWTLRTDGATTWGAALNGPALNGHIAQIGPGYNDTAVPGRHTPIRQREDGNFYRWSWNQVLNPAIQIVLLETWNEMHEGTSLCHSREYGRNYIELTRRYTDLFHRDQTNAPPVTLQYTTPQLRPPSDVGKEYRDVGEVCASPGPGGQQRGLMLLRQVPDGPFREEMKENQPCAVTPDSKHAYLYFDVADPYLWNTRVPVEIHCTYWDDGFAQWQLEYDGHGDQGPHGPAYTASEWIACTGTGTWKTRVVHLEAARFANRQNGGADFRFTVTGGRLAVTSVRVKRRPDR